MGIFEDEFDEPEDLEDLEREAEELGLDDDDWEWGDEPTQWLKDLEAKVGEISSLWFGVAILGLAVLILAVALGFITINSGITMERVRALEGQVERLEER